LKQQSFTLLYKYIEPVLFLKALLNKLSSTKKLRQVRRSTRTISRTETILTRAI